MVLGLIFKSLIHFKFIFFMFFMFYLFILREKDRAQAGEGQTERERENPKEALHCQRRVQSRLKPINREIIT